MPHKLTRTLALLVALGALHVTPALADDGCTVLLCLAGDWRHIEQCVPPVRKALRDMALGRGWPSCSMVSASGTTGTGAAARMLDGSSCPPQYTVVNRDGDGNVQSFGCLMSGTIDVTVNGALWSKTYWNGADTAVTWYSDTAKSQLGNVDPQYDQDLANWKTSPAYADWDCAVNGNCYALLCGADGAACQ